MLKEYILEVPKKSFVTLLLKFDYHTKMQLGSVLMFVFTLCQMGQKTYKEVLRYIQQFNKRFVTEF